MFVVCFLGGIFVMLVLLIRIEFVFGCLKLFIILRIVDLLELDGLRR